MKNYFLALVLMCTTIFAQAPSKVSTLAGTMDPAIYMKNHYNNYGTANQATFQFIWSVAVTPDLNTYSVEKDFNFIKKTTPAGITSKYTGSDQFQGYSYTGFGFVDGTLENARFSSIKGLCSDASGNIYVADWGNKAIRKISGNNVTTLATGFVSPQAVTSDSNGNVYVADGNSIKKITASGTVSTITGSTAGGNANGALISARFRNIEFLTFDQANNILYASDSDNSALRKIDLTKSLVSTISFKVDGFALVKPAGHAVLNGYLFIADVGSHVIFKLNTSTGIVTRYAGSGYGGFRDGLSNIGPFGARFNMPVGLAVAPNGNVIVVEYANNRIRKVEPLN